MTLPVEVIRLVLMLVLLAASIFGVRIYRFDPGKRLNRVSAISLFLVSILAFVEFEITHVRELSSISQFSIFHTSVSVLLILFAAWSARLFGWDQRRLPKWLWDLLLFILGVWTIIVLYGLLFDSFKSDYGHYMSEMGMWKYYVNRSGFYSWTFHGFVIYAAFFMSFSYFIAYINSEKPYGKRWKFLLFITYTIIPILLMYYFIFRIGESVQGDYVVSPFLAVCVFALGWIYSNFKLFEISPASAVYQILDSMSNLVLITDEAFFIKFSNNALTNNFGIGPNKLRNQPLEKVLDLIQMDDWKAGLKASSLLKQGEQFETEFSTYWKEEKRYFLAIVSPVFNTNNHKTGYVIVATDLSMSKKAEFRLREYADRLEQSNKELEQFAYIASHDLKSPLRNIISFVNLLERKIQPITDVDVKDYLQFITSNSKYMYKLIQDVLEYSTVKKKANDRKSVNLNRVLKELIMTHQTIIQEGKVIIELGDLPEIQSNPFLMSQLFQNLIINGIKYNQNTQPLIKIGCKKEEDCFVFSIQDNGIGIEEAYHNQVFGMFKRLQTSSYYDGTGIGLAICKRIVQLHNGKIWLNSKPNEGSTFYFTLGQ